MLPFICTTLFTDVLSTQQCFCQQTFNLQKP